MPSRLIAALTSLLVVAGLLAACGGGGDSGPRAASGALLSADVADSTTYSTTVQLPWGTLQLTAGKPQQHLTGQTYVSKKYGTTYDKIAAPKGGTWLAFGAVAAVDFTNGTLVQGRTGAELPATTIAAVDGQTVLPVVTLPASLTKLLAAPRTFGDLALPWKPTDLHLRVTFDGATQDVYLASRRVVKNSVEAAATPATARKVTTECGNGTVPGYRIVVAVPDACMVSRVVTAPYAVGLGWAGAGRHYLAIIARTTAPDEVAPADHPDKSYVTDRGNSPDSTVLLKYGTQSATPTTSGDLLTEFVFDVADTDEGSSEACTLVVTFGLLRGPDPEAVLTSIRTFSIPA